jgi:hypothetical protein
MGLITRQIGPNDKGSKLTFAEMDNNLYYLQGLGVSGLTYSANTLTITNPTGGTLSVTINDYYTTGSTYSDGLIYFDRNDQLSAYTVNISSLTGDSNTFITAFTYTSSANTLTLTDNINNRFNAYIDSVSGLTVNGGLSVTGNTNINNLSATTISATTYQNLPTNINFGHTSINPADNTTYYIGGLQSLTPSTANRDAWSLISLYSGNIDELSITSNFVGGSSENSTISIHNLTSGTSQIVTSALQYVSGTPVQINYEPFSAATIPSGWSSTAVTFTTSTGGYALLTGSTSLLVSPVFNGVPYSTINVVTDVAKFGVGTDGPILIEYSTNSGSTWITAGSTATPTSATYLTSTVQIPTTSSEMLIRFSINPSGASQKRLKNVYFNGVSSSINNNYTLSTPLTITKGDKLQIRWVTPTWDSNPTSVTNLYNIKLKL